MFVLGHLGIGAQIFRPWIRRLPPKAFWLGALLPDLIDKTTYYSLSWKTGLTGIALPIIHGTRSFGHTGLFLLSAYGLAWTRERPFFLALSWGILSHFVLDWISDQWIGFPHAFTLSYLPVLWPFNGEFPISPHPSLTQHLLGVQKPFFIITELLGGFLIFRSKKVKASLIPIQKL
jgi:hypothetical protein